MLTSDTLASSEETRRRDGAERQQLCRSVLAGSFILSHRNAGFGWLPLEKDIRAEPVITRLKEHGMGNVLFVGEGNLSFALTMSRKPRVSTSSILATVCEAEEDLTDTAYDNARKLLKLGCSVKTGVDATRLSDTIGKRQFRTIIFQFPNVASRDPRYGQNPNHVLVARFLKSARNHLKPGGLVVVSTVDSPYYEGAFKMDDAARKAGFAAPDIYTFDPKEYPGYTHQNTANEESAADGHTAFATFVFSG